ncbi:MAG TPA: ABC transporter permease [Acidothermaceae bacterium]|nr:ABC transporter permease [Acidothermaceae bacterium]
MNFRTGDCLEANSWICAKFISTRQDQLLSALQEHVTLTVETVAIALAVSLPLAIAVRRGRQARGGLLGLATAVYSVPSLALFGLLVPITGLRPTTVLVGLVLYSLTILIRNVLAGLDSVPAEVVEAARGMGMGRLRILLQVELPLATPSIFAGLRVATVSTVALATIGYLIGEGGLGNLIHEGLTNYFKAEVLTASVLCVLLAVGLDAVLVGLQFLLTPWARRGSGFR